MSLLIDNGKLLDGSVSVANGTPYLTQPIQITDRKQQTVRVTTDVTIQYDILVSFDSEEDADFVTTSDINVSVTGGASVVNNYNYSANFMRLNLHANASAAKPSVDIHTQPNAV